MMKSLDKLKETLIFCSKVGLCGMFIVAVFVYFGSLPPLFLFIGLMTTISAVAYASTMLVWHKMLETKYQ